MNENIFNGIADIYDNVSPFISITRFLHIYTLKRGP